jgi:hypothetical protein
MNLLVSLVAVVHSFVRCIRFTCTTVQLRTAPALKSKIRGKAKQKQSNQHPPHKKEVSRPIASCRTKDIADDEFIKKLKVILNYTLT